LQLPEAQTLAVAAVEEQMVFLGTQASAATAAPAS